MSFSQEHARKYGLPIVTVLPAWMFGPGDAAPTSSGKFVQDFLNRRLPGTFDSGIDVVDARDVAKAMLSAVKNGQRNEQYLLSAAHVSIEDICRTLEQVTGIQTPTRRVPTAMIYIVAWISERIASLTKRDAELTLDAIRVLTNKSRTSSAKAVKQLGVTFRPLEETMRDTAQWFMANG